MEKPQRFTDKNCAINFATGASIGVNSMKKSMACCDVLSTENSASCEDGEVLFIDTNSPRRTPGGKDDGPLERYVECLHPAFTRN